MGQDEFRGKFHCEFVTWVGEPEPPGEKRKDESIYYRPYTTWPFRRSDSDVPYLFDEHAYRKYVAEVNMLKLMYGKTLDRAALVEAIKGYAQIWYDEARDDAAEEEAGASL